MFMKKPANRVFDYPSRHYSPESDEMERKKRKLGFTRKLRMSRKKRNPLIWVILLIIIILVYLKLSSIGG